MRLILSAALVLLSGCSLLGQRSQPDETQAVRATELAQITNAEKVLNNGSFDQSLILYKEFQGLHPQSTFLQAARLGEAQSLAGLERWQEALELYRDITVKTRNYQPEIAAQALYRMSFAYEAQGDDLRTVSTLLDAKKLGQYLPLETALAEIPARLAIVYGRQDREDDAVAYLNEAERGIEKVQAEKGTELPKEWLAKTYVQMGGVSTNQLGVQNFSAFVRGQKLVQIYLFRAVRLNDTNWSTRAKTRLQETYRDLFTVVESQREQRRLQSALGAELLGLIDQAELYRPPTGQKMNSHETEFFAFLADVRKKTEDIVYTNDEVMGLTEESQRLNSLRRSGRVKADSLLPAEEKATIPLPPKVVPSEDPNL
ncbi:tetratricopeptide repeat protein [Bdellovibrio bacteriovorus]|uniref:Uncharacterized protein n=1 Tax=Bdellovibrio bacteriovorus TaxID=959 RepID=A0A1Z3N434_BDEBC|nr:hypothetical protein [Bdellovibrio bacteriovorus]ASD62219.1 hypothetical protein B9G79_00880 [Bdellovibrio bacteriovorus]